MLIERRTSRKENFAITFNSLHNPANVEILFRPLRAAPVSRHFEIYLYWANETAHSMVKIFPPTYL